MSVKQLEIKLRVIVEQDYTPISVRNEIASIKLAIEKEVQKVVKNFTGKPRDDIKVTVVPEEVIDFKLATRNMDIHVTTDGGPIDYKTAQKWIHDASRGSLDKYFSNSENVKTFEEISVASAIACRINILKTYSFFRDAPYYVLCEIARCTLLLTKDNLKELLKSCLSDDKKDKWPTVSESSYDWLCKQMQEKSIDLILNNKEQ